MRVIGLTGGIGTGKTTVSQMLQDLGAALLDADKVGHQSYLPDSPAWKEILAEFGEGLLQPNREIDRRKLGSIVFANPSALAKLNSIVHPRMRDMIQDQLKDMERQGVKVVVFEAAILIEAKWTGIPDEVWVTDASEDTVVLRLAARNGWSEEQARARIASQLPRSERLSYGDVVIDTDCSLDEVRKQVQAHWRERIGLLE
ncbi:MAG: coaE [Dehalococcoidia bacterium]|nr:coaE [Dehalococcoidia bacterium]